MIFEKIIKCPVYCQEMAQEINQTLACYNFF